MAMRLAPKLLPLASSSPCLAQQLRRGSTLVRRGSALVHVAEGVSSRHALDGTVPHSCLGSVEAELCRQPLRFGVLLDSRGETVPRVARPAVVAASRHAGTRPAVATGPAIGSRAHAGAGAANGGHQAGIDRYFHLISLLTRHPVCVCSCTACGPGVRSPQWAWGHVTTRQWAVIGLGWGGRCVSGVHMAHGVVGSARAAEDSALSEEEAQKVNSMSKKDERSE
eukprot:COSAG06_NODE_314_length_17706_cov_366.601940_14_plen_224_part_00